LAVVVGVVVYFVKLKNEAYKLRDEAQEKTDSLNLTLEMLRLQQNRTEEQRQKVEKQQLLTLEANYNRLIQQGNFLMQQSQYQQALLQFQNALDLSKSSHGSISDKEAIENTKICLLRLNQKTIFESYIAQGDTLMTQSLENVPEALERYQFARETGYNDELAQLKINKAESEKKSAFFILKDKGLTFANAGRCDYAVRFLAKAVKLVKDKESQEKLDYCLGKNKNH